MTSARSQDPMPVHSVMSNYANDTQIMYNFDTCVAGGMPLWRGELKYLLGRGTVPSRQMESWQSLLALSHLSLGGRIRYMYITVLAVLSCDSFHLFTVFE